METVSVATEAIQISGASALDTIHVFWVNVEPGQGYVTIICYGCAWTAYFGGMMGATIQGFFLSADVEYLVSKMGNNPTLKQGKKYDAYLRRIIEAVKASLASAPPAPLGELVGGRT